MRWTTCGCAPRTSSDTGSASSIADSPIDSSAPSISFRSSFPAASREGASKEPFPTPCPKPYTPSQASIVRRDRSYHKIDGTIGKMEFMQYRFYSNSLNSRNNLNMNIQELLASSNNNILALCCAMLYFGGVVIILVPSINSFS